jgi:peptidyl-prolyl cis-trans isomerase B (cyclophilin B)
MFKTAFITVTALVLGAAAFATQLCPACGAANPDENDFCEACGSPLKPMVTCPQCGERYPEGTAYCTCGYSFREEAASADLDNRSSATEVLGVVTGMKVAVLELEKGGQVWIELLEDETPVTVGNFIRLVEDKFYDGIPFHRVVPDFVVQAGDATLVGRENPDISLEIETDVRKCVRGAVSMARLAWLDEETGEVVYGETSPTQFFILKSDRPHLDRDFCVFGVVVAGMEVVDNIEHGDGLKRLIVFKVGE